MKNKRYQVTSQNNIQLIFMIFIDYISFCEVLSIVWLTKKSLIQDDRKQISTDSNPTIVRWSSFREISIITYRYIKVIQSKYPALTNEYNARWDYKSHVMPDKLFRKWRVQRRIMLLHGNYIFQIFFNFMYYNLKY